jgi:hypothetical protein
MRRTYSTLNDYEMQHNAEVGLFTGPSKLNIKDFTRSEIHSSKTLDYGFSEVSTQGTAR